MQAFFVPNPAALADLLQRSVGQCMRFRQQALPPGSRPAEGDIGFEVQPDTGHATLWVQHGVQWRGSNPSVQRWLDAGRADFATFSELVAWVQGELASTYHLGVPQGSPGGCVTDLAAVAAAVAAQPPARPLTTEMLHAALSAQVFGQPAALRTMATTVTRHLARVQPSRPAVLFMLGPTGVGKTRSAEVLGRILAGQESGVPGWRYLRLDMSEYQEAHRISQLLGAPQGYVGHGEHSQFVQALADGQPCVVLFDEIEKAHPSILKALMNGMDAGRLSSAAAVGSQGHVLDCRRCIFLFTSNLEAQPVIDELRSRAALGQPEVEDEVCRRRLLRAGLAPEIVGRIGRFLVFQPIEPQHRAAVLLAAVQETAQEFGLHLQQVEPAVLARLLQRLQTGRLGARAERLVVDEDLGDAFAAARLAGWHAVAVAGCPAHCTPVTGLPTTVPTTPAAPAAPG